MLQIFLLQHCQPCRARGSAAQAARILPDIATENIFLHLCRLLISLKRKEPETDFCFQAPVKSQLSAALQPCISC